MVSAFLSFVRCLTLAKALLPEGHSLLRCRVGQCLFPGRVRQSLFLCRVRRCLSFSRGLPTRRARVPKPISILLPTELRVPPLG